MPQGKKVLDKLDARIGRKVRTQVPLYSKHHEEVFGKEPEILDMGYVKWARKCLDFEYKSKVHFNKGLTGQRSVIIKLKTKVRNLEVLTAPHSLPKDVSQIFTAYGNLLKQRVSKDGANALVLSLVLLLHEYKLKPNELALILYADLHDFISYHQTELFFKGVIDDTELQSVVKSTIRKGYLALGTSPGFRVFKNEIKSKYATLFVTPKGRNMVLNNINLDTSQLQFKNEEHITLFVSKTRKHKREERV